MNTPTKTLALMIDADNAQLTYTKQMIQFCEVYGALRIKRAYGDWKQPPLSAHCQTMTELGIKRVQQNRVAKDATDFKLAMEIAVMLEKDEVDIYFIVSGDGHFTPVCEQIRQKGAQVIVIGSKANTSSELRKFCNRFFFVEEIVKNQSKPPTKSSPAPKPETTPMLEILIQAYEQTPQENGWVLLAQLGNVLRQLDKQFEERFAGKKLSSWFKKFPHKFEVTSDRVRMV